MAVSHYDPNSHELPQIDKFYDAWNFMIFFVSIRDALQFCNNRDTIVLRMFGGIGWIRHESHEYWQDSITIHKSIQGNTARKLGMNYDSVKKTPKACKNQIQMKGNLWLLWTFRVIFSIELDIKAIYPCLGITSNINVHRKAAVVVAVHTSC